MAMANAKLEAIADGVLTRVEFDGTSVWVE